MKGALKIISWPTLLKTIACGKLQLYPRRYLPSLCHWIGAATVAAETAWGPIRKFFEGSLYLRNNY